jgi:hypothetical protein
MLRTAIFRTGVAALVLAGLVGVSAQADVYRYKDDKGNVQYTDRPQTLPAERISVQSSRTDTVDIERPPTDTAPPTSTARPAAPATSAADQRKAQQTDAAGKAEACNKARQDFLNRMNAPRLYEEDAKGERRYLDDKQTDAARAAAKQAMDTLCN